MSDKLKMALYVLLYDSTDVADFELDDSEETYIQTIIELLVKNNGITCPYKNYGSEHRCPYAKSCGENRWDIDCGKGSKEVWRSFIKAND